MSLNPPPEVATDLYPISPYGYEEYLKRKGDGSNALRTDRIAQPRTLVPGDTLANGDRVLAKPLEAGNGGVWVLLSGGFNGHWIRMAARLPIALLVDENNAPESLVKPMQY